MGVHSHGGGELDEWRVQHHPCTTQAASYLDAELADLDLDFDEMGLEPLFAPLPNRA